MRRHAVLLAGAMIACGSPEGVASETFGEAVDDAIDGAMAGVIDPALGPRPACALPPRRCRGAPAYCHRLIWFYPQEGPGYQDTPLDDERTRGRSSSYLRRDLVMLVQYAAAKVACEAAAWPGRGGPIALGDMSQRDGELPGTWRGQPRHPPGTHEDGASIDVAYYQLDTPDHAVRPICPHVLDGVDQLHCVGPPTTLDALRTALFVGALFEDPMVRVVGVDGRAAPPIAAAFRRLCQAGWIRRRACDRARLASETEDTGRGWYFMHHHHLHVGTFTP